MRLEKPRNDSHGVEEVVCTLRLVKFNENSAGVS
jgi:hypothetical protein